MTGFPTIIDCDPGTDDIAALILAHQSEAFDVRAITITAGNTPLDNGLQNALDVTGVLGWDVPVAAGATKPLACDLVTAADIHGGDGKHGVDIPRSPRAPDSRPAWQVIWDEARAAGEAGLDLIAVGPLTNVALALAAYPDLPRYLRRIVWMGGAILAGNTTPAAEFNAYVDPEAAERVLHSGVPTWVLPLDVTHECYVTLAEIAAVEALGTPATSLWAAMMGLNTEAILHYTGGRGVALHDPAAVLFAADPSAFTAKPCWMGVETQGAISRGMTVVDAYSDKKMPAPNVNLVETVDREAFMAQAMALLRRY